VITRYVNTDSTAGGDGTTNALTGANRAFATLSEALTPYHATTLSDQLRIYCAGVAPDPGVSASSDLDHVAWEFTTSPTNFVEVIGDNITGKWNVGAYRIERTNSQGIYNQYAAHVRLYNLQIMITATAGGPYHCFRLTTANNDDSTGPVYHLFKNCIARRGPASTSGEVHGYVDNASPLGTGANYRVNCQAIACTGVGAYESAWDATHVFNYNCLAYACQYGFIDPQAAYNCVAVLSTSNDFLVIGAANSNNASSDGSAPGSGSKINQVFTNTFVDAAGLDFHLRGTDTVLIDAGVSNPGAGLYSDDIDGQIRIGAWDIGPDEYTPPPPPPTPIRRGNRLRRRFVSQVD